MVPFLSVRRGPGRFAWLFLVVWLVGAIQSRAAVCPGPEFAAGFLSFRAGNGPFSVALGDFNGDTKAGLVVANVDGSSVPVLLGNGDGTFAPRTDFVAGAGSISVAVADLNADGKLDLVTANTFTTTVSVFLGIGNGTFAGKVDYT